MSTHAPLAPPPTRSRRAITQELWLVFALSLGASGVRAVLDLVKTVVAGGALSEHTAILNGSQARNPWLDLALQLTSIATALAPVLLVAYFLSAAGDSVRSLGLDATRPAQDMARGAGLAAVVGGTGLALYLGANAAGFNLTIVPENLPSVWWRIPVLLLSAAQNSLLEEVLVAGFLLHQLRRLGWGDNRALIVSALLRGSYHLYQGLGGFFGNVVMGLLFGRLYQRWGRVAPLVVAHALIDAVAFVGYIALAGRVSWIPQPAR